MSDLLERIVAQYEAAELDSVFVPEWDERVYFRPETPREAAMISGVYGEKRGGASVATVMVRALNEAGKPLFDVGIPAFNKLRETAPVGAIARVYAAMMRGDVSRSLAVVERAKSINLEAVDAAIAALAELPGADDVDVSALGDCASIVRALQRVEAERAPGKS